MTLVLPAELCTAVFRRLDALDVCRASQVCRRWRSVIQQLPLWRALCVARGWADTLQRAVAAPLCSDRRHEDACEGFGCEQQWMQHYRYCALIEHRWRSGAYSNPQSYEQVLMCRMSAETWGAILQHEMRDSGAPQLVGR